MSKSIRCFISLLLVLQLIIPCSVFAAAVGEFTSVVGKVTQTRAKEVTTPVVKSADSIEGFNNHGTGIICGYGFFR